MAGRAVLILQQDLAGAKDGLAQFLAFSAVALPGQFPGAPGRDVVATVWPDAGVAVGFAPALNGLAVHAQDRGELDRALGIFVTGRSLASESRLKQIAFGR